MPRETYRDPSALDFDELRKTRHQLRDFLEIYHERSIGEFEVPYAEGWFKLHAEGPPPTRAAERTTKGNLSTSATCVESLLSADPGAAERTALAFSKESLKTGPWHSDGGAAVYCPARTLPVVLRFATRVGPPTEKRTASFLGIIWSAIELSPDRHGVREAYAFSDKGIQGFPWQPDVLSSGEHSLTPSAAGYPPNAFHTYWALRCFEEYRDRGGAVTGIAVPAPDIGTRVRLAWAWCRSVLALQTALCRSSSPVFDGDQLGWALATRIRWSPRRITEVVPASGGSLEPPAGEERDLIRAGLSAFFSVQSDDGRWPRFAPLFHYPASGNAHCYFFETLSEILRPALLPEAFELRLLLRPHLRSLAKAWQFAQETAMPLPSGGKGWCSGHHPQRTQPEGWATAAVYTFLQNLRKLVAIEADYVAREELNSRRSRGRRQGLIDLRGRGDTWRENSSEPNVGEMLGTMFVHPVMALLPVRAHLDPDVEILAKRQVDGVEADWARSAILFGPPGTSKTTLARAVADAIGWDLVEIHASAFLAEGIDQIPAVAERIFARLQELHRTVILFDEIEELLRERADPETDPFGRFLTTLMLPKLAALWKQRRVLFFVNTNLVTSADDAIKRSERFDALILVETPSYRSKKVELDRRGVSVGGASKADRRRLALVRYDQLAELAERVERGTLKAALAGMFPDSAKRLKELEKMRTESRRDYRACRVVAVAGVEGRDFARANPMVRHVVRAQGYDYFILKGKQAPKTMRFKGRVFTHDGIGTYTENAPEGTESVPS
jgi:hypothetical protein